MPDWPAEAALEQGLLEFETWNEPPRRLPGPAAAPVLVINGFEGPLDWLLDLARSRRIDLARLSIADLIEAFEAALTTALTALDKGPLLLTHWGAWLVMATELTLLRSRLLVPAGPADAQAAWEEAERLRRRLLRRAEIARAADWLEGHPQLGQEVFARGMTNEDGAARWASRSDITALLRACLVALRVPAGAGALYRPPAPPVWSVADAIAQLRAMLPVIAEHGRPLAGFLPAIPADAPERERRCRIAVSATFLAGLELTRDGAAELAQDEPWQTIQISCPATGDQQQALAHE